jgi:predicted Zn-dependent peptidase
MRFRQIVRAPFVALTAVVAASMLAVPLAGQAPAKQQPPAAGPSVQFNFPAYKTHKLPNGLTLFIIEDHRQPLVSYTLMVDAGGIAHPPAKAGLASMTAELLTQGTATRSAQDIARAIDGVGGSLSAAADDDTAQVTAAVAKSAADLAMELLADVVLNPAFTQEEIDRLRRQRLSGLQISYTDPEYIAPFVAARLTLGDHPYAYPVEGTPDSLRALTRDEIVAFHKSRYTPQGAFLAISGDITPEAAIAQVEKRLGSWSGQASQRPATPAPPPAAKSVFIVDKPDAVQTQIVLSTMGIKYNDPSYFPLLVANQIFGGAFTSRLNMALRAREGLTYGARSSFDTEREAGMFRVSTFTRTEETGKAVTMVVDLLREFRKNPATDAELKEAKAYLIGSFAVGTETPGQVAGRVLTVAKHGLPADYWDKYRDNIQAVTTARIAEAVGRYVDADRMKIVAVGNAKGFAPSLAPFGEAKTISFSELDLMRPDLKRAEAPAAKATPESSARAMEILKGVAQAMGGAPKLAAIKDTVVTGAVTLATPQGDMQGDLTIEILYPDKIKTTVALPMGQMVQASDGQQVWVQMGPQAQVMPPSMTGEMKRSTLMTAGGIGVIREALEGRADVQALEPAEIDGKKVEVVRWNAGDQSVRFFIDPASHRIVRAAYRSVTPQGASDVEANWSDYKDAGGLTVPGKVVMFRDGQKFSEATLKEVKFNVGLDPKAFSKQ